MGQQPRTEAARRIIFVNRYFYPDFSATSQILFDLTRRLVRHGFDVHVLCSGQLYEDANAKLPLRENIEGIEVHRLRTTRFGRAGLVGRALDYASFYATAAIKLLALLRASDIVVAKTDPPLLSIPVAGIARIRGATAINWLQDIFPEIASRLDANPLPKILDALLKKLRDQSLRLAAVNIVLGARMRDHLIARNIPDNRIRIIENWADTDAIRPLPASASQLREKLGLTARFVVEYSGNLGRAHEFETILGAALQLRPYEDIHFLMIGGGNNMTRMKLAVSEQKLGNVSFLPYQERAALSDSLAAGDVHLVCLLPELEGLVVPSKFYGVLAAARPVIFIGDEQGELSSVIRRAQCGAVVRTGDGAELAVQLMRLRDDAETAAVMGARARSLLMEKYTADHAASQWLAMLAEFPEAPTPPIGRMPTES